MDGHCIDHLPGHCNCGQVDMVEDLQIKMEKSTAEQKGFRKECTFPSWGNEGNPTSILGRKKHVPLCFFLQKIGLGHV
jgi:hypothetical protein